MCDNQFKLIYDKQFVFSERINCGPYKFECDGICHDLSSKCDGIIDCSNGFDELGCVSFISF